MRKKRTLYNYEIPREKLKAGLYDSAILGVVALTLFFSSFFLDVKEPFNVLLPLFGLFSSKRFLYNLYSYYKNETFPFCLAIDTNGIGFGFEHNNPQWWIFLDTFSKLEQKSDGWWYMRSSNAKYIYFPDGLLSMDDLEYLKEKTGANLSQGDKR